MRRSNLNLVSKISGEDQIILIDQQVSFVFVFRCLPLYAFVYCMNKHKLNTPEINSSVITLYFPWRNRNPSILLVTQRIGGIGGCGPMRLGTDNGGGDQEGGQGRAQEHWNGQTRPIGKILKPRVHGEVPDGPSY